MIWPLNETLTKIQPHLPLLLVSTEAFLSVQAVAQRLPSGFSAYYLECRLAERANQVDFSTSVFATAGGHHILAAPQKQGAQSAPVLDTSIWQRLQTFFGYWSDRTSPMCDQVPIVWLEFDIPNGVTPKTPEPSIGICLDPKYLERQPELQHVNHPNTQKLLPFMETALGFLLENQWPAQRKQNLMTCFECLPSGGQISYVSAMLPRQLASLKVNGYVPKASFLDYLRDIAWTGSLAEIEYVLARYCAWMDKIRFDITVEDEISPRLGIEFFFIQLRLPNLDEKTY